MYEYPSGVFPYLRIQDESYLYLGQALFNDHASTERCYAFVLCKLYPPEMLSGPSHWLQQPVVIYRQLLQAHGSSNILPTPQQNLVLPPFRLQTHLEACDRARQCFRIIRTFPLLIASDDPSSHVADITIEALLDFLIGFTDVFRRHALLLAEDVAREDLKLCQGLAAVRAHGVHDVDHVVFVSSFCKRTYNDRNLNLDSLFSKVSREVNMVIPLDTHG